MSTSLAVDDSEDGQGDDAQDASEDGPAENPEHLGEVGPSVSAGAGFGAGLASEDVVPNPEDGEEGDPDVVDDAQEQSHSLVSELNDKCDDEVYHPDERSVEQDSIPEAPVLAFRSVIDKFSSSDQQEQGDQELSGVGGIELASWLNVVGVGVEHLL